MLSQWTDQMLCLSVLSIRTKFHCFLHAGASIPHGESHSSRSTTEQENQRGAPEQQTAQRHVPAPGALQWGFGGDGSKAGASFSLLAPKVPELPVDGGLCPKHEAQDLALARSLETLGWQGASCTDPKTVQPLERPVGDTTLLTVQVLRSTSTF